MRTGKNLPFAFFLFLGMLCFSTAFSQDDRLPDLDSGNLKEPRFETASDGIPEMDSKIGKSAPVVRDTIQTRSTTTKKVDPKKQDDNSVLSFNFLYYLIERYKLSDIVD